MIGFESVIAGVTIASTGAKAIGGLAKNFREAGNELKSTKEVMIPKFPKLEKGKDGSFEELDIPVVSNLSGTNIGEVKERQTELTNEEKIRVKEETNWSDEIVDSIQSMEEYEVYKNSNLKEEIIDGKPCLIRDDINMEQKDDFGRTNRERMEKGHPPITKDGESIELHHIGQKSDSPLAELTKKEHKENDGILHDKKKESEIDRNEFGKERKHHWKERA